MSNLVAIVGRPNVGKSTLFNRLIGERQAIMDNESGVTRDRHYGYAEWQNQFFTVIDTGGYVVGSDDVFEGAIRDQVRIAIEESDVIVFMVDITMGLTELDKDFAQVVRRSKKPVFLVANKSDTGRDKHYTGEFYALGMGEVHEVSGMTGSGTGDLLDEICKHLGNDQAEYPDDGIPRVALIGRPNVGKSSLANALLGEERNIVTDIAGTTRDAIDSHYKAYGFDFILTDTAGLRRKAKLRDEQIEFYSTLRTAKAIESSDVCLCLIDAVRGIEAQDVSIINLAVQNKKGVIVVVNKWDAYEAKSQSSTGEFEKAIYERIPNMTYIPIVFVSATTKQRILKAVELMVRVHQNRQTKISTSALNDAMLTEMNRFPPPVYKGKAVSIKFCRQLPTYAPTFAFFCNLPQYVSDSYAKWLEARMREHFDLVGVPITILFKKKV